MRFTLQRNAALGLAAVGTAAAAQTAPLDDQIRFWVAVLLPVLQAVLQIVAQRTNPDGRPVAEPYERPRRGRYFGVSKTDADSGLSNR